MQEGTGRLTGYLAILGLLFLLSGATGLVYEVTWFRLLFLKLGGTGLSVATVTATFMLGLGLGAWLFGTRLALRMQPVRLYGLLEAIIGLYALVAPSLVTLAGHVDALVLGGEAEGAGARLARFLLAGMVLLPPTICMGGTLPALARLVEQEHHRPGRFVGVLYGLNTLGAVLGAGCAGFLLLPSLGFTLTVHVAAAGNLLLAGTAFLLASKWHQAAQAKAPPRRVRQKAADEGAAGQPRLAVLVYAASGAIAFMLQVAWARILTLIFASSVYAFSLILVIFLTGLGAGAVAAAPLLDRFASPRRALAWTFALAGTAALLGQGMYERLPGLYLSALMETETGLELGWAAVLAAAIMLPVTLALGAGFPLAVRLATGDARGKTAARVGRLYAGNTAGSVVGAFSTALVLIPAFGLAGVVSLAGLGAMAVVVLLVLTREGPGKPATIRRAGSAAGVAVAVCLIWTLFVPGWNRSLMSESVAFWRNRIAEVGEATWDELEDYRTGEKAQLLFYRDGVTATVAVKEERPEGGLPSRYLTVDGKVDASSLMDMPQQVLLAHLPLMSLDSRDAEVMVIGLASGITTGSVLTHPVGSVVVLEIEDVVMEASRFFDQVNLRPLEDPRTQVVLDDARAYLERTDRRFDVISSSPSSPWLTGPSKLFTRESMALIRAHLKEGGVLCQYVQAYDLDEAGVLTLLRTIQSVFPSVAVFEASGTNLLVLASDRSIDFTVSELSQHWALPAVREDLQRAGIQGPCQFLERVVAEPEGLATGIPRGPLNTDDNALLEYRGPQAAGSVVSGEVVARLRAGSHGPAGILADLQPDGPVNPAQLAMACLQEGAHRTAASLARKKLSTGPDPDSLWVLAEIARGENRRLQAMEHLEQVLEMWPDHPPSLIARALTLHDLGRLEEALEAWERASAVVGEVPLLRYYRGLTRRDAGDAAGAVEDLGAALQAEALPQLPIELYLAAGLETLGLREEARVHLEAYVSRLAPETSRSLAAVAARQRLADLLGGEPGEMEWGMTLVEQASADRRRLVPSILVDAAARLEGEGEASARAYLAQLGELDPRLPGEIEKEIDRRRLAGNPLDADLVRMVTRDH
jgi:spermidine synthase